MDTFSNFNAVGNMFKLNNNNNNNNNNPTCHIKQDIVNFKARLQTTVKNTLNLRIKDKTLRENCRRVRPIIHNTKIPLPIKRMGSPYYNFTTSSYFLQTKHAP